jgi:hypothetical protein
VTDLKHPAAIIIDMEDAKTIFGEALCRYGPLDELCVDSISLDDKGDFTLDLTPMPQEPSE